MNRVLARQLRRLGLSRDEPPRDQAVWEEFLARVGAFYDDADRNRYLLERSMEISSREMHEVTENIRHLARREMDRQETLSRHNFYELPVAAWLEDYRGVAARLEDLRASGIEDLAAYLDANPEAGRDLIRRVIIVDCNPAVTALVGVEREELLGPAEVAWLSQDSLDSWRPGFQAIWDKRPKAQMEFTGRRADGTSFVGILHWSVASIEGEYDYSRVMVVMIDISDRIEAEEKMRQLVVAKDEFLASVSHELRTPLTSVLGYARVLLDDAVGEDERRGMLATVADQAFDLANIVDDLLVGARSELGQLDVALESVEVDAVIAHCLASFPRVARPDHLRGVEVMGDSGRIRQILRNLLSNAERYGGPHIVVRGSAIGGMVEITVADDGPVVMAGLSGMVFERYYREEGERRPTGSVGIGLTISRELARLMGGDLTYRYSEGWSEFVLTLPKAATRLRAVG